MKLYDHPLSPYAMKIRISLYEKGLDFEKHEIHTESDAQELAKLNPRVEVPALADGDALLFDSKVIAEYLEERYAEKPLMPADPVARAQCRALELFADAGLDAAVLAFSLFRFFRPETAESHPEALAAAEASLRDYYAAIERRLAGREYFLGEFGRADIAFAPHVGALAFLGLAPGDETPQLAAWHARVSQRESVARTSQEAIASIGQEHAEPFFDTSHLHWRSDRIEQLLRIGMGTWLLEELESGRGFLPPGP